MSQATCCRLCVNICTDYRSLYDENGHCLVESYEMVVKYFDPMFLAMVNESQLTVVCSDCWQQISEFYSFQKSLLLAQVKLLKGLTKQEKQTATVSAEEAHLVEETPTIDGERGHVNVVKEELELIDAQEDISMAINSHDDSSPPEVTNTAPVPEEDAPLSDSSDDVDDTNSLLEEYDNPPSLSELDLIDFHSGEVVDNDTSAASSSINTRSQNKPPEDSTKTARRNRSSQQLDDYIANWRPTLDCPICRESLRNFADLYAHFQSKHPLDKCHILCCELKFNTRFLIAEHARFHNGIKCEVCGKIFESINGLSQHRLLRHRQTRGQRYHKQAATKKELDEIIARWQPKLECVICKASFATFTLLDRHFRQHHPKEKLYVACCHRKLTRRLHAVEHMQLHMDPEAFKCQLCGKCLKSSKHMYGHMSTAHAWKASVGITQTHHNYKCSHCEKSFSRIGHLREHMARHLDKELYKCLHCAQTFRYRSTIYRHLKSEHPRQFAQKKNNVRSLYKLLDNKNL